MLHFFKRIRQNLITREQIGKYVFYAIGEIILVVIGILIALKVNNSNVERIEQDKIRDYARVLIKDLEEDVVMFEKIRYQTTKTSNRIDSLAKMVKGKRIDQISNIDFVCLSWNLLYMPYSWNRVTLEQLKNSGSMQYIKNDSIIKMIADYDALTHHLDEDYFNDKVKTENSIELIHEVVNNNYSEIKTFRSNVLLKVNHLEYDEFSYFQEPDYLLARSMNLKLITDDIRKIHKAVNSLIRLQFDLNIRSNVELPRLKKYAENLIEKLKSTYNL